MVTGQAAQMAAAVVVRDLENRPAVALTDLLALEHCDHFVRQIKQPDQVRDLGSAAADPSPELLLAQAKFFDEFGAGPRLFDRIQVFADHVLDQRHLQAIGLVGIANDHRDLLDDRPSGRPANVVRPLLVRNFRH